MIEALVADTTNGRRVAIALGEMRLSHRFTHVNLWRAEHRRPDFLSLNRAGQIPVIIDEDAPGGPLVLTETVAILIYLAEKSGCLLPPIGVERAQVLERLIFQAMNLSAPKAQAAWLARRGGSKADEFAPAIAALKDRALAFYRVLDAWLGEAPYLGGNAYSIADIMAYPMAATFEHPELDGLENLAGWRGRVGSREAVTAGLETLSRLRRLSTAPGREPG